MLRVRDSKIVKNDKGEITHDIPFIKLVVQSMDDITNNWATIDAALKQYGYKGRTDYVAPIMKDGKPNGEYVKCLEKDDGAVKVFSDGLLGAINNGIDLAIRAAILPKKPSAATNREAALEYVMAEMDAGRVELFKAYRATKAEQRASYLDELVKKLGSSIPGVSI